MSLLYEPVTSFDEENHIYSVEGIPVPSTTTIIKEAGMMKNLDFYTSGGSGRGTYIHKLTEQYDKGTMDWGQVGEYLPYVNAYIEFKEKYNLEVLLREEKAYNRAYWYAGQMDIVGRVNGKLFVIDIKTGQEEKWHYLQLILYSGLIKWKDEGGESPLKTADLYLKKNGKYKFKEGVETPELKAAAFGAVHVAHYKEAM